MKRLLFAIAGAAAFSAFAADPSGGANDISLVGFENYTVNQTVIGYGDDGNAGGTVWSCQGDDASLVKAYGVDNAAVPSITEPRPFAGETNTKYLALDTNGSELKRAIPAAGQTIAADGTYIDTLVQFTPSESAPTAGDLTGAKLAIWLGVENNVTNLMVAGGSYTYEGLSGETPPAVTGAVYKLSGDYAPNTWYRLTVKAIANLSSDSTYRFPGFQIMIDGVTLTSDVSAYDAGSYSWMTEEFEVEGVMVRTVSAENALLLTGKTFIPSADATKAKATLTAVGFKGTGALDDFVVTTEAPDFGPAPIDFSLTWPSGLTASYKIGDGEPVALTGAGSQHIQVPAGSAVQLILENADGATKTYNVAEASSEANAIDASAATFTWADYLGEAVDGAYEIDNLAELKLFQKGVAFTTNELKLATAGETFKLTADIALDAAWPGIGVQNGKDIYSTEGFNAAAFQGTFDGQNHTISGFQMVGRDGNLANVGKAESAWEGADYCGFFNSTYGATIQNLKIAYAGGLFAADTASGTKESGATFVGVAKNSTLRNLTTVAGTVSCSKGFGGIVGYLTSGTTVDSCTNNVNMTSLAGNKCGGIAMIAQGGSAVTITNCQNNGTQTTSSGNSEYGAIVGYVGLDVTIADCETTVGRFLKHQGNTVTLQGVNKGDPTVPAYHGAATPGLNFATVYGSTATFVADTALAAGNTYKVLGPSATATYEFAAAGSISFDTNLIQAVTFAITAPGLDLTDATESGVVTFTAAAAATPLNPGQDDGKTYTTEEAAAEAAASVTIAAATEVATELGVEATANYVTNFEAKAVSDGAGGYTVQVVLKESVEEVLQEQANADAGTVAGALDAATATVTTTPGFYYSIKYGGSLDAMNYRTAGELATGASKALTMPTKPGTSGFYKVVIDIAPSAAVAPAQE